MAHLKHTTWQTQRGLTLVELMVTIAVIAILATTAVSTMSNMRAKQQVIAAAEEILSKAQRAKSLARKKSEDFQIILDDESDVNSLAISGASISETSYLKSIHPNVVVTATTDTFGFAFLRGTATSGSISVISKSMPSDYCANVKISGQGRLTICSEYGLDNRYGC